jgi:hypothetical protein
VSYNKAPTPGIQFTKTLPVHLSYKQASTAGWLRRAQLKEQDLSSRAFGRFGCLQRPCRICRIHATRRALELLASCANGRTEALMLAHGFSIDFMVALINDGLATAHA